MSGLARPMRTLLISSSARGIATTSAVFAAVKGKAPKSAAPKKKQSGGSFAKKPANKTGGGGGGGSSSGGLKLSFSNAREVPSLDDLPVFHPETLSNGNIGQPATIPLEAYDAIKSLGLPRKLAKELSSPSGPALVIRESTLQLAGILRNHKVEKSSGRYVLAGDLGSGKSTSLLQSVLYARESDWIVIYVPKASEWTNSSHSYVYNPSTKTFDQPSLSAGILTQLLSLSTGIADITLPSEIKLANGQTVARGASIDNLIKLGRDNMAAEVLEKVMDILASQTDRPVLLAIDEGQSLFDISKYRTPDAELIESYDLSLPKLALEYISGRKSFKSGTVLTALSIYPTPPTPTLSSALSLPTTFPLTPYTPIEPIHHENAKALNKITIPSLSTSEAAGLFELYAKRGWVTGGDEKYLSAMISSGGNVGDFGKDLSRSLQRV